MLLIGLGDSTAVRAAAARLTRGLIVAVDSAEKIYAARRSFADMENVLCIEASPDHRIPWQDGFFTVVAAPEDYPAPAELQRVLSTDGRRYSV